jgi:hypothetical protein
VAEASQWTGSVPITFDNLFKPFTFDDLYELFARDCVRAWDAGLAANGRPGVITSVTLPEGVFPGLTQLLSPMDRAKVPVHRVPLAAAEYPAAVCPSPDSATDA